VAALEVIEDCEVTERPSQARVLSTALVFGMPILACVFLDVRPIYVLWAGIAFLGGLFGVTLALRRAPKTGCRVRVVADSALEMDGTIVARRGDLVAGTLVPRVRTHLVLKRKNGSTLEVATLHREQARALLDALGLGAAKVTAEFSIAGRVWSAPGGIAAWLFAFVLTLVVSLVSVGPYALPIVFTLPVTLALLALLAPAKVVVGTDAIVTRWLGARSVVPLDGVVRVETLAHRVRLHRRDGSTVDIRVGMPGQYAHTSAQTVGALAERIETALAARAASNAPEAAALARSERSVADWVASLRRALSNEPGFRGAALVADRLWPLVEDASTNASTRVAAAVALAPTLDDEGRARVRVAASASASPKLRVALEAAAEDDVDRVVEALGALEAERRS